MLLFHASQYLTADRDANKLELCAVELVVGGGVAWSYDRRRRRAAYFSSASAASDWMREHGNSALAGQAFFSGFTGVSHFTCDLCYSVHEYMCVQNETFMKPVITLF